MDPGMTLTLLTLVDSSRTGALVVGLTLIMLGLALLARALRGRRRDRSPRSEPHRN